MIGGELVREARKRAGLTQQQLAERAGVSKPAIARLESGRTSPSLEQVERLMRLAGFDLIVALSPRDDQDRWQSHDLRRLDVEHRLRRNDHAVRQMRALRKAVLDSRD